MVSPKPRSSDQPLLRSHILDAARAIVVRQGFDALSMRKLAHGIGYSPASLYLHFDGRDAIALALGAEGHATLLAALHACESIPDEADRLKSMAFAYVEYARSHAAIYRLIFMQNAAFTDAIFQHAATSGETVLSVFARTLDLFDHVPSYSPAAAETVWTALHGIASLSLTAAPYLSMPTDKLIESALHPFVSSVKNSAKSSAKKKAARKPFTPRAA